MFRTTLAVVALAVPIAAAAQYQAIEPPQSALDQQYNQRTVGGSSAPRTTRGDEAIFHGSGDQMSPARKAKLAAKAKAAADAKAAAAAGPSQ